MSKIAGELRTQMNAMANDEEIPVIVMHKTGFFSAQSALDFEPEVRHKYDLVPAQAFQVRAADIEKLEQSDSVERIWPDLPVHTCLDVSVPKIEVPAVRAVGLDGQGIKLAVVDTGLDPNHPDFAGRIVETASFVGGEAVDDNGHGTHVAGIAAGSGAASNGKYTGVAPGASLYIAKVLDARGSGSMSGVMAGIEWAVNQNVHVINLSLGGDGPCDGSDALSTLCDAAVQQRGVVLCVAAGNAGPASSTVGSPGCARQVITIGATDDNDRVTRFSSRGPTSDGRNKPDLVFPGNEIVAPQAAGTQLGPVVAPGYISISGTSMATPHASGVVALLLQAKGDLTPEDMKLVLTGTTLDLGDPANVQGTGRGNAFAAYQRVVSPGPEPTPEPTPPPTPEPTPEPTPTPEPGGCRAALARLLGRG
ncbi:MAG: S8 family peptidase [Anaerolineae bacterium]